MLKMLKIGTFSILLQPSKQDPLWSIYFLLLQLYLCLIPFWSMSLSHWTFSFFFFLSFFFKHNRPALGSRSWPCWSFWLEFLPGWVSSSYFQRNSTCSADLPPSLHDLWTPGLGHVPIYIISVSDIFPIILHDNFLSLKISLGPLWQALGQKCSSLEYDFVCALLSYFSCVWLFAIL